MDHTLASGGISATIKAEGAELCSLKNADGLELLWQAGPAWTWHSPILFPIVGQLKNDELRHQGKTYPMTRHGFARDRMFAWGERGKTSCTLVSPTMRQAASTFRSRFGWLSPTRWMTSIWTCALRYQIQAGRPCQHRSAVIPRSTSHCSRDCRRKPTASISRTPSPLPFAA